MIVVANKPNRPLSAFNLFFHVEKKRYNNNDSGPPPAQAADETTGTATDSITHRPITTQEIEAVVQELKTRKHHRHRHLMMMMESSSSSNQNHHHQNHADAGNATVDNCSSTSGGAADACLFQPAGVPSSTSSFVQPEHCHHQDTTSGRRRNFMELSRHISQRWRELDAVSIRRLQDQARIEKQEYRTKMVQWRNLIVQQQQVVR